MAEATNTQPAPAALRYSRQVLFEGIGAGGQARLGSARVAVVGCGALGAVQASLLARAGVGYLRVIDRDFVDETNLQRQILFDEEDVRDLLPKAVAAERALRAVNSTIRIEGIVEDVNPATITRLLAGVDLVMDATDNFDVRFLLNDFAVRQAVPWIYGGCVGAEGTVLVVRPGETPCLSCLYEGPPPAGVSPTCDTAGILGSAAGVVASLQVAEALKILCGRSAAVSRVITSFNLWENRIAQVPLPARQKDCPCCARREFAYLEGDGAAATTRLCGRRSVQIMPPQARAPDLDALARRWAGLGTVERNRFLARVRWESYSLTVFADGRALVGGTTDVSLAKSLHARYVGS